MSEMVDRVAKALIERGRVDGAAVFLATIAIEAMREPTEAIRLQLEHLCDTQSHNQSIEDGWRSLIDAATCQACK